MRPADYRLMYRPRPDRVPRWLLRVWAWVCTRPCPNAPRGPPP